MQPPVYRKYVWNPMTIINYLVIHKHTSFLVRLPVFVYIAALICTNWCHDGVSIERGSHNMGMMNPSFSYAQATPLLTILVIT